MAPTAQAIHLSLTEPATQSQLRSIVDTISSAVYLCDQDGLITYYNQRAVELWGCEPALGEPDELYCSSWQLLLPDGTPLPHEKSPMATVLRTGVPIHGEQITIRRPDATSVHVVVHSDPLFDSWGRPCGAINVLEDITQRKEAEERLRLIQELSEAVDRAQAVEQIYDLALDGLQHVLSVDRASILLLDANRTMRFAAWRSISDAYRARMDGRSPWAVDDPNPAPVLIPDVEEAEDLAPHLQPIRDEGIRSIAMFPLLDQGQMLGRLSLYYDQPRVLCDAEAQWSLPIARHVAHALQRKRAEERLQIYAKTLTELNATLEQRVEERTEELQRSNRDLEQFAYVASHDLKAPLRAISNLASWIAQDAADVLPSASRDHLNKLRARVHRMEVLLNDLLSYSRVGHLHHLLEKVDTAALVQRVVEMLAPPKGFSVVVSPTLPVLTTEHTPLEAVFRNLIGNAIKHHHNPRQGRVEVTAQERGAFVEFSVRDNGPGIAPVFHQRIFEMFQTLESRDRIEGSGIGLTMILKHVESRGGTVRLESEVGHGATFRFTWPKGIS